MDQWSSGLTDGYATGEQGSSHSQISFLKNQCFSGGPSVHFNAFFVRLLALTFLKYQRNSAHFLYNFSRPGLQFNLCGHSFSRSYVLALFDPRLYELRPSGKLQSRCRLPSLSPIRLLVLSSISRFDLFQSLLLHIGLQDST